MLLIKMTAVSIIYFIVAYGSYFISIAFIFGWRKNMNYIIEPERKISVVSEVDICVVGGSCTGVFAAIRSARLGAKVCIVEKSNCFGGVATNALVNVWHSLNNTDESMQIIGGLTNEILERLKRQNAVTENEDISRLARYAINTEELKIELDTLVKENEIIPFLHTQYCGLTMNGNKIKNILIENKSGRQAISAKMFIDATGDGDLLRDAGISSYKLPHPQPPTSCYKITGSITNKEVYQLLQDYSEEFELDEDWGWGGYIPGCNNTMFRADTHVFNVDCGNGNDITHAEMLGREQIRKVVSLLKKYHWDSSNIGLIDLGSSIGIRETVHYESNYSIKGEELMSGKVFEDAVAYGTYPVDIHHNNSVGITFRYLDGRTITSYDRTSKAIETRWHENENHPTYYQIPLKSLVQNRITNIIAVGRMINADEEGFAATRVMVNLNQLGEAAGVTAYIAVNKELPIYRVSSDEVRACLAKGGSIILPNQYKGEN